MFRFVFLITASLAGATWAAAETIDVKYTASWIWRPSPARRLAEQLHQPSALLTSRAVHGRAIEIGLLPLLRDAASDLRGLLTAPSDGAN